MAKPAPVETFWVKEANLYQTKDKPPNKIASISISKLGHIIFWHEAIPQRISQRLSSIWTSGEAAEFIVLAAFAEAQAEKARKEAKE